jgi:hypothetical protein
MRHILVSIIVVAGFMWCGSQTFAGEADHAKSSMHQYRTVTVEKVQSGLLFLGQPSGVGQRTVSVHKAERMGLLQAKKGDEVILVIDENDMLIDLHMKGVPPAGHRLITGKLTYADPMWEVVEISNAEGKHTLAVDGDASNKVFHFMNDHDLMVAELNEDNMVIDIHHLH